MRRPVATGVGIAAALIFAACSPDQPSRGPLAPTEPSLAVGDICSGSLASQIAKEQKALFTGTALNDLQNQFQVIKSQCPNVVPQMWTYLDAMLGYYDDVPIIGTRPQTAATHLYSITLYVTGTGVARQPATFSANGGAAVMTNTPTTGDSMTTFDKGARLIFAPNTQVTPDTPPNWPRLFTFEPKSTFECDGTTGLPVVAGSNELRGVGTNCYLLEDYPHATLYSPAATLSLCMKDYYGETGIIHQKSGFGTELLPEVESTTYSCSAYHTSTGSWLRDAGPLGRVLARAYEYLAPRPLFADDAGESGSIDSFSLIGGAINELFSEDFDELLNPPDIGDSLTVVSTSPGYIRIENGIFDLPGSVVVLSQGQGACQACPVFKLLGHRTNSAQQDSVGTYEITWKSLQNKPNVKEAPFVVLDSGGAEIARLSYVTESSKNILRFNGDSVGTWIQNDAQSFKITVTLKNLSGAPKSVSLSIDNGPAVVKLAPGIRMPTRIGYILDYIDAGIIYADDFSMVRIPDIPPQ